MTAIDVARKDLADAIRSRGLWLATAVFVVVMAVGASLPVLTMDRSDASHGVAFMQGPATELVLPTIALLVGYRSIVGERERGSMTLLLSLPQSRRDVLAGKFLGRSLTVAVPVLLGFTATGAFVAVVYGPPPLVPLVSFALVSVLAGSTFVSIAVGVSALVSTRVRAISILVCGLVFAAFLWRRLFAGLHYLVVGAFPETDPPAWFQLLVQLNPLEAYGTVAVAVLPETPFVALAVDDAGAIAEQGPAVTVPDSAFTEPWFGVAVLVAWIVASTTVGYLRFREADLV